MKIVIMAGGKGTRFWPRSTDAKPKQFLALISPETMIQETYRRFRAWLPKEHIYVATAKRYVSILQEQLPELDPERMIIEPEQKDTGPCVALTALRFLERGDDDVLVTAPSDQYIADGAALREALVEAAAAAREVPAIVTLGVVPTRPETGYGYIECAEKPRHGRLYPVQAFIEKPTLAKAKQLYQRPNIVWNSGIFVWRPSTIAYYMKKYQAAIWDTLKENMGQLERAYAGLPKISVDYAIMEKAERIYNVPVDFAWDDVGLWSALQHFHPSDRHGNLAIGDVYPVDSGDNIVWSDKKTILIGVRDLIVVSTGEGLLVCHKSEEQKIKNALADSEKGIN